MTTKKLYTVIIFSENTVGLLNQITIIYASAVEHRDAFRFTFRHTGYT